MSDEAERIAKLFLGCELGYGTYLNEKKTPGKVKSEIKDTAKTIRGPTTLDLWRKHLSGERSLGIIPIREDGMCYWGVIDVDMYDLSHRDVANKVKKLGLPLVLCKSKSGGAHLFVFLSTPVSAAELMAKLREFAAMLGYGNSEVFPKQTQLLKDKGDLGNWLNMPYFMAENGNRYAVDSEGRGLSLKRFLDLAERSRLDAAELVSYRPKMPESAPDFGEGPPCLQHLSSIGVDEGGRNNALFGFGVLAKKMKPDSWDSLLQKWNQDFIKPPVSNDELQIVIKSLRKKDYTYKCKDMPLVNHCDSQLCRIRRFGIGAAATPNIVSISILDAIPAIYFVSLEDGKTVQCSIDDILNPRAFQKTVLMQTHQLLPLYKQDTFHRKISELIDSAIRIEAPSEVSTLGIFKQLLQEFLTDQYAARTMEEIMLGKPYFDEVEKTYWFRSRDLTKFLEKEKFKDFTTPQTFNAIRSMGGASKYTHIKQKGMNLWHLPAENIEQQRESLETPRKKDSPI